MRFREDQIPILEYNGGTMAVSAVPGAGKTFIVSHLASKIIEKKSDKGKVLIVTYMNSAVNNFKSRISQVLESHGIHSSRSYEVMTIHSLAMKIIQERPDVVGLDEDIKVLDDINKSIYIDRCIDLWRRRGGENTFKNLLNDYGIKKYQEKGIYWWKNFVSVIEIIISELKLNSISCDKIDESSEILGNNSIVKIINYIYKDYEKLLKLNGYVDYEDIIVLAYSALKTDENLKIKFQNKYDFVFEDECQDSNMIQYNILSLISQSGSNNNLVRVGDLNQSIMGSFTSSNPRYFEDFIDTADKKYIMNMAGRSSREIIDLANYIVEYTQKHHSEKNCRNALKNQIIKPVEDMDALKNPQMTEYGIKTYCMSSWEKEKESTVRAIINFKKKHPDMTTAVLVPFNKHVSEISQELIKNHIDCDELSSTSGQKIKITNILGKLLAFLAQPDSIDKFKDIIYEIIDGDIEKKDKIIECISKSSVEYMISENEFRISTVNKLKKIDEKMTNTLVDVCYKLKNILENSNKDILSLLLYIENVFRFNSEDSAMLQLIASYIKYERFQNPNITLDMISEQLLDIKNPVFRHMSEVIYSVNGYEPNPEKVAVSTYHKSKGLEWDCVFLLYLNNYTYPSSLSGKFRSEYYFFKDEFKNPTALGKAEIEKILGNEIISDPIVQSRIEILCEKIRILYVAVTRAKRYLICMAHYDKSKKDLPSEYFKIIKKFADKKCGDFSGY
ncbi:ATP-dependent helicase [Clostridium tyrobutyricum]|jgi:DNA helicase-2/ATP-dependent DNA helicase PcrA|uniref:ATP-dependent helicase n=1 Tax=Clostridium tyrobutyricum TaxID=1519 RepID=UPI001C392C58|nr:ATP-dependent helicase [Clostridium tyrobutyricum]MBV4450744.1 ATP-dependent helicase [Clostridium tyrobutyricum]MCH4199031.1 ATP-dependent helicase [Clostridium tyrobutyricum]MCH4257806.1 ATP-dependent helicase [Clostridium tyrobutyricum]MCI1238735.1 ATP-dependent helicase [Clostridium tyrobutyricum]MCI1652540.1 ATP-dependent helicase [Clostridium tyrobutyricum]